MPSCDLTDSDRRFLEEAVTCFKEPPELDVDKMMEKLGIKHKSVTNKWGIIKKKIWGEEVARAAGEKTRMAGTAAGLKRKRDAEALNPPPPKPVKEKPRFYVNVPTVASQTGEGGSSTPQVTPTGGGQQVAPVYSMEGSSTQKGEGSASVGNGNEGTPVDGTPKDGNESW